MVPRSNSRPYRDVSFFKELNERIVEMKELIIYLITFFVSYLFYVVFVLCRSNVLKKYPSGKEMRYLQIKYKLKINDKNIKIIANKIFLANSFI